MRGMALLWQTMQKTPKDNVNGRTLLEQALQIDPNDVAALAGDASIYLSEYLFGWGKPQTDYDAKVLGQAERAIAIAPDYMFAHRVKSYFLASTQRFNEAVRAADAGLAINPNYPDQYSARGSAEISLGRFEQAKSEKSDAVEPA
jgi:adenylate cyclase